MISMKDTAHTEGYGGPNVGSIVTPAYTSQTPFTIG
jgi:hypothetical protein